MSGNGYLSMAGSVFITGNNSEAVPCPEPVPEPVQTREALYSNGFRQIRDKPDVKFHMREKRKNRG